MQSRMVEALNRLERNIEESPEVLQVHAPAISAWSVGEHYDHLVKVADGLASRILSETSSTAPACAITLTGRIVLLTGRIPRGKGKAPQQVWGESRPLPELLAELGKARLKLQEITAEKLRGDRSVGLHPVFGELSPRQWYRFLEVHHRHHERIVKDILKAVR